MIEFEALKELEEPRPLTYARPYLGMSSVGGECDRQLLLSWRWTAKTTVDARIQRIFDVGHLMEEVIVNRIKAICEVKYTGLNQLEFVGSYGHWKGHPDGILIVEDGQKYLLEIKTHKDSLFKQLEKLGVKDSHPSHYAQMQAYMNFDASPDKCLYIAYNKDTSEFYTEVVEIDFTAINSLKEKMDSIPLMDVLPPRIGPNRSNFFKCKMCDYSDVCFEKQDIAMNCRTCKYVEVHADGIWKCSARHIELDDYAQQRGCDGYELDKEYFQL